MGHLIYSAAPKAFALVCIAHLSGCASVAVEAAHLAIDEVTFNRKIDAAWSGDPAAQYAVGKALCCSGDTAEGTVYNTAEALFWLCRAADRGNVDAMEKLAQIFEGDQVDGLRMIRRAISALSGTPQNRAAAYYWYVQADSAGRAAAGETAADLHAKMSLAEQEKAARYFDDAPRPCSWADLAGPSEGAGS
ncbi:MAG: hypothetical protein AAGH74_09505 [Pseudomonadota bacterium]